MDKLSKDGYKILKKRTKELKKNLYNFQRNNMRKPTKWT